MKLMKKLLIWAIIWAVAISALFFILDNVHHVVVFVAGVSLLVVLFVKYTSPKRKSKTRR